jgi:hypothetical protein
VIDSYSQQDRLLRFQRRRLPTSRVSTLRQCCPTTHCTRPHLRWQNQEQHCWPLHCREAVQVQWAACERNVRPPPLMPALDFDLTIERCISELGCQCVEQTSHRLPNPIRQDHPSARCRLTLALAGLGGECRHLAVTMAIGIAAA